MIPRCFFAELFSRKTHPADAKSFLLRKNLLKIRFAAFRLSAGGTRPQAVLRASGAHVQISREGRKPERGGERSALVSGQRMSFDSGTPQGTIKARLL